TRRPVMSRAFSAVEGFEAVDLEWPVFSRGRRLLGSVSLLLRPDHFLAPLARQAVAGKPGEVWVMQPDGWLLYHPDAARIGGNLRRGIPKGHGPDRRGLAALVAARANGRVRIRSTRPEAGRGVWEEATWTTVQLHGTVWRVVRLRPVRGASPGRGPPARR